MSSAREPACQFPAAFTKTTSTETSTKTTTVISTKTKNTEKLLPKGTTQMMTNRTQTKIKSQERQTRLLSRRTNSETDSHRLLTARVLWCLSITALLVNKLYLKVSKRSLTGKKMKVKILRKASRLKVRILWRRKIESL